MRLQASWKTALPALVLSVACAETRSPTELAAGNARFEAGVTTTTAECVAQIDALVARTSDPVSTPISGKSADKDRAGLVGKLTEASAALEARKPLDAVQKLQDYTAKVQQLAAAGRLSPETATALTTDAQAAITCIQPPAI